CPNLALNCGSSLPFICDMSRTCVMNSSSVPAPAAAPGDQAGALEVSGVTVRFAGLTALDGVSLTAAPRKVTGLIGPHGAGKPTPADRALWLGAPRGRAAALRRGRPARAAAAPPRLPRHRAHAAGRRPVPGAPRRGERHDRGHPPCPGGVLVRAGRRWPVRP